MFDRFDDRTLEIATVIVVVVIALVILCYMAIYINPWVFFNPLKPATPTALAALSTPVLAPTWTPTPTATDTSTPPPTLTWTPTPLPTNTPTPTDSPTPTATSTSTPLPPTATSKPKPKPPTATPTPWPYYYETAGGRPNCDWTGVWGYVVGANGLAEADVEVRVGNNQNWSAITKSNADGIYGFIFAEEPKAGRWFSQMFKGGQPRSMQFWFDTSAGCNGEYSLQEIRIDWRHR